MAPNAMMAAEMAIIRLTHVANLPAPEELVRKLQDTPPPPAPAPAAPQGGGGGPTAYASGHTTPSGSGPVAARAQAPQSALARFATFPQVVDLIRANRDVKLLVEVETTLRLVSYAPGRIEFEPGPDAPRDLAARLGQRLQSWTGARWAVSVTASGGAATIAEDRDADKQLLVAQAEKHPLVQAVLRAFPQAKITEIRTPEALAEAAATEALPEVEEEWDPFEED